MQNNLQDNTKEIYGKFLWIPLDGVKNKIKYNRGAVDVDNVEYKFRL